MGRNLLRTESWHRKVRLRQGQTVYFNNGTCVEQHQIVDTYYGRLNGKLVIHTRNAQGEHHLETKWGLVYLGTDYRNALMVTGEDRQVVRVKCDKYAKLHSALGKASRDRPMDFWEAGYRGCTIIPRRKKIYRTKKHDKLLTGNKVLDGIAGEGLRRGDFVRFVPNGTETGRIYKAYSVAGAAEPNPHTHEGCLCCELNKP